MIYFGLRDGLRELRKPVSRHDPGAILTTVVTTQVLQVYILYMYVSVVHLRGSVA